MLSSPLDLHANITCTGSHELTAQDVDNLQRRSDASVTAVDEYAKIVSSAVTDVVVAFAQVMKLRSGRQQEDGEGGRDQCMWRRGFYGNLSAVQTTKQGTTGAKLTLHAVSTSLHLRQGLAFQPAAELHNLTRSSFVWQVGSIDLTVSWDYSRDGQAASTTDEIGYTYTIINNGLLTLYNIGLRTEDPEAEIVCGDTHGSARVAGDQSVEGLASYLGDHGLAPAASLVCRATGGVSRETVSFSHKALSDKCCQG